MFHTVLFCTTKLKAGSLRRAVANGLNCDIIVREFEIRLSYFVHFPTITLEKGMNPPIPPAIG